MSLLDRIDVFLFAPYATVYRPPPKDDLLITLVLFTVFCAGIAMTCGHYLAK